MNGSKQDRSSSGPTAVADEAVRLAEVLAGLMGTGSPMSRSAESDATKPADSEATPETKAEATAETETETSGPEESASEAPEQAGCSCQASAAVGAVCQVCPICRLAGLVDSVRPETMERIADLLGMVAGSLQAVAADRRSAATPTPGREPERTGEDGRDEVVEVRDADPDEFA